MSSWTNFRCVVLSVAFGGGMVTALAQQGEGAEASLGAEPTVVEGQPVPKPAPEARVPVEPREISTSKPGRPTPESKPAPRGEQVNVRIDLKIRAQKGSSAPVEKSLALVVIGDDSNTAVRTSSSVPFPTGAAGNFQYHELSLNADVRATVEGRQIRVALTLEYNFAGQALEGEGHVARPTTSSVSNQIRVVLEDGKALVVSDQVDAASDYRITVEAKATTLR